MSRSAILTIGFLLVMIGVQLNMVDTYTLTPQATQFLRERLADNAQTAGSPASSYNYNNSYNTYQTSPYYQTSYPSRGIFGQSFQPPPGKQFTPPTWLCWPVIFMGVVMVLHGAALKS